MLYIGASRWRTVAVLLAGMRASLLQAFAGPMTGLEKWEEVFF